MARNRAEPDEDLCAALEAQPAALALFAALDSANRYVILYRVQPSTPISAVANDST